MCPPTLTASSFIGYPHWAIAGQLKAYYLVQAAYWVQQVLVLLLRLERPRKDHNQFMVHHCVTIWLIRCVPLCILLASSSPTVHSWSYAVNLTYIGQAVYLSMDIPEVFFSVSLCLQLQLCSYRLTAASFRNSSSISL